MTCVRESPDGVRDLGGGPEGDAIILGVVGGQDTTRFQGRRIDPRNLKPPADHPIGVGKRSVGIAALPFDAKHGIGGRHRMNRSSGLRGLDIQHRRQRLVFDQRVAGGVLCLSEALPHDDGDRLPHIADLAFRQYGMLGPGQDLRPGPAHNRNVRNQALQVCGGEHGQDTGHGKRRRSVHAEEPGMGLHAPRDDGVNHSRQLHVPHETAPAPQQMVIFNALLRAPCEAGYRHIRPLDSWGWLRRTPYSSVRCLLPNHSLHSARAEVGG